MILLCIYSIAVALVGTFAAIKTLQLKRQRGRTVYWRNKAMTVERETLAKATCNYCGDLAQKETRTSGEIKTFGQCFHDEKEARKLAETSCKVLEVACEDLRAKLVEADQRLTAAMAERDHLRRWIANSRPSKIHYPRPTSWSVTH